MGWTPPPVTASTCQSGSVNQPLEPRGASVPLLTMKGRFLHEQPLASTTVERQVLAAANIGTGIRSGSAQSQTAAGAFRTNGCCSRKNGFPGKTWQAHLLVAWTGVPSARQSTRQACRGLVPRRTIAAPAATINKSSTSPLRVWPMRAIARLRP